MKLNIEELAREAELSLHWGADDNGDAKQYYDAWPEQLEAFALLVVERCAVEVYNATDNMHEERDMVLKEVTAEAIRKLLEAE